MTTGRQHEKMVLCKPRTEASEETKFADLGLKLPASRTGKKKSCCVSHSVCGILLQRLWLTSTGTITETGAHNSETEKEN